MLAQEFLAGGDVINFLQSRLPLFGLAVLLSGCSSFSLYKESDCELPPERYGVCFAELGYRPQAYEILTKFCKEHGKELNADKFTVARKARLSELCSRPEDVFRLSFRDRAGLNGPEICPKEMLKTDALKQAEKDGRESGYHYSLAKEQEQNAQKMQRESGSSNGSSGGLFFAGPKDEKKMSEDEEGQFQALLKKYPKSDGSLTTRLTCSSSSFF